MKMLRITLEGKTYEVGVEVLEEGAPAPLSTGTAPVVPPSSAASPAAPPAAAVPLAAGCRLVTSPMAGSVFKCLVKPGDAVTVNQVVVVLDAMKMETPVVSPFAGTVKVVLVKVGDAVDEGLPLVQIEPSA